MDGLFEIVNPLSLVLHLVNLVILYIVFKKFLYKPVAKFLKDRQDKIAQERASIDQDRAEVDALKAKGDGILDDARTQAEGQAAQIMAQADKDAKAICARAQEQAKEILENARQEAEEEKKRQKDATTRPGDGAFRRPGRTHSRARNQPQGPSEVDGGIPIRGEVICSKAP